MRKALRLMGPLSSRSWSGVVGCMGYSGVCGLCRSTHLACHIVCLVLAILRIGVVVYLGQFLIYRVGVFFGFFGGCVVCCVSE